MAGTETLRELAAALDEIGFCDEASRRRAPTRPGTLVRRSVALLPARVRSGFASIGCDGTAALTIDQARSFVRLLCTALSIPERGDTYAWMHDLERLARAAAHQGVDDGEVRGAVARLIEFVFVSALAAVEEQFGEDATTDSTQMLRALHGRLARQWTGLAREELVPPSTALAWTAYTLGRAALTNFDAAEAANWFELAARWQSGVSADTLRTIEFRTWLVHALNAAAYPERAREVGEELLHASANLARNAHPRLLTLHLALADSCAELGDDDAAISHAESAVGIAEELRGLDAVELWPVYAALGYQLWRAGRHEDALAIADYEFTLVRPHLHQMPDTVLDIGLTLIVLLSEVGEDGEARKVFETLWTLGAQDPHVRAHFTERLSELRDALGI